MLKKDSQKRKSEFLATRQKLENEEIESFYQQELSVHNSKWQEKFAEFKQGCKDAEDQLNKRQALEFESTKTSLEESIPIIPKHSPELLNLKKIQDTLVRNKEYKQAHYIQQKMIELEEKLKQTWGFDRDTKIQQSMAALTKKQENEQASFKQKILAGAEEMKKMKEAELDGLVKKYQNLRKEIVITHKLEKNRLEGKHTTGCGTFRQDLNQSSRAIFNLKTPMGSRPATAAGDRSLMSNQSMKSLQDFKP